MNQQLWNWIGWGVSILSIFAISWLFINPKNLGVKETRLLAAKAKARDVFWFMELALVLFLLDHVLVRSLKHQPPTGIRADIFSWLLPATTLVVFLFQIVGWLRTPTGIAEAASDEMVNAWKRRKPKRETIKNVIIYSLSYLVTIYFLG
jgi:hypothetical protein